MTNEHAVATSLIGRRARLQYVDSIRSVEKSLHSNPSLPGGRQDDIDFYDSWDNTDITILGVYREQGWFSSDIKVICETSSGQMHTTTLAHLTLLTGKEEAEVTPEAQPATIHESKEHLGE